MSKNRTREAVLRSLVAIGSARETAFYTALFQEHSPEKFALIVLDPRCLKNPLLEALLSTMKILSDIGLTPILVIGALDDDPTSTRFQTQRLCRELEAIGIINSKLNCASYQLIDSVQRLAHGGRIVVLEMTESRQGLDVAGLIGELEPAKVIFLQPSGAIRVDGKRLDVVDIDDMERTLPMDALSKGQGKFLDMVQKLAVHTDYRCTYVMASPLNLLGELFTVKGTGTMLRRGAKITSCADYSCRSMEPLRASIENAFSRSLKESFFERPITYLAYEANYRAGAILSPVDDLQYLSKFWVTKEARGEGLARDVWRSLLAQHKTFFWRSRNNNHFNTWYMKICDGMQISGEWRVFWKGLSPLQIPNAVTIAANFPDDFEP
jgi:acetylglutamate kinase